MPLGFLGNVFGSAIGSLASAANTKQINETNLKIAEMTNKANRELVDAQNKAAKEESELAYQRSKPTTQVANLTAAGMSRAGAINTLNGGGSYTPAPVNTSQDSAPQMQTADLTALANIGQGLDNIAQRKHEEKMAKMQIAAQKEENAANRQNAKDIAQLQADTTKETATNRLEFDKQVYENAAPLREKQLAELDARIKGLNASTTQTKLNNDLLELEKALRDKTDNYIVLLKRAEALTAASSGELQRLIDAERRGALLEMDKAQLRMYYQYKLRCDLSAEIGNAIKDEQWSKNLNENKFKLLQMVEFLANVK